MNLSLKKENPNLRFLNYIVVSDSDDSYLTEKQKPLARKLKWVYLVIVFLAVFFTFAHLFLPPEDQIKWTQSIGSILLNFFIFIVLTIDYVLRWITYPVRSGKYCKYPLLTFPLTGVGLLMLFCLLPLIFIIFAKFVDKDNPFIKFVNVFGFIKILRLVMLLNVVPTFKIFSDIFKRNRILLVNVFVFLLIMTVIFALLIYSVEGGTKFITEQEYRQINNISTSDPLPSDVILLPNGTIEVPINDKINNFWDSLYFTFITITTIGYGDISPATSMGRIVVTIDAIFGIVIFSIPGGIITGSFIVSLERVYDGDKKSEREKELRKLSLIEKIIFHVNEKKLWKITTIATVTNGTKINRKIIIVETGTISKQTKDTIITKISQSNIKEVKYENHQLKIEVVNYDQVEANFFELINLLNYQHSVVDVKEEKNEMLETKK